MSQIGDCIRGDKIGKRSNDYYVWVECPICHRERWILKWKLTLANFTGLCWTCSARKNTNRSEAIGIRHPRWNGGQTISRGYVYIFNDKHPACTSRGYVKRARLILEETLGRYLLPNYLPHHINGIKDDDRSANLLEVTKAQHQSIHSRERWLIKKAKSFGRKEVVEFIKEHGEPEASYTDDGHRTRSWLELPAGLWQVQLQEWRIDEL